MKKLIASLAVAFLMSAGLVAAASTTATAGPYSGTVSTITTSNTPDTRKGKRVRVNVTVRAATGNGVPRGPVQITISNRREGTPTLTFQRFYNGSPSTFSFRSRLLTPGPYSVTVTFVGQSESVYRGSANVHRFNLAPRRR